MQHNFVPGK